MQMIAQPTIGQCVRMVHGAVEMARHRCQPEHPRSGAYLHAWRHRVDADCSMHPKDGSVVHQPASACLIALTGRLVGLLTP